MRSTAPRSIGTRIATPSSGANAADIGRVALPGSPCCRGLHDLPDEPLRVLSPGFGFGLQTKLRRWFRFASETETAWTGNKSMQRLTSFGFRFRVSGEEKRKQVKINPLLRAYL